MKEILFSFKNVSVIRDGKAILDNVSFDAFSSEQLSIIGPNGSGKTTLVRTLLGIETTTQGCIALRNRSLENWSRVERGAFFGYVPQQAEFNLPHTVFEYALLGRFSVMPKLKGPRREDVQATKEALSLVGLGNLENQRVSTLSGGERQRLLIAAALAHNPTVLILDEPTSHLDPSARAEIFQCLADVRRANDIAMVSVVHDINAARRYSDKILSLREGKTLFYGSPAEVCNESTLAQIYDASFSRVDIPFSPHSLFVVSSELAA